MTISPDPRAPETMPATFERSLAPSIPGNKGPLRFEEGVATDTDVPNDFARGARSDPAPAPGRMNHANPAMFYKSAADTTRERAHVGSSSWVEAPSVLDEFVQGAHAGAAPLPVWDRSINPGVRMARPNATVVSD